jgi:hypothetical protein
MRWCRIGRRDRQCAATSSARDRGGAFVAAASDTCVITTVAVSSTSVGTIVAIIGGSTASFVLATRNKGAVHVPFRGRRKSTTDVGAVDTAVRTGAAEKNGSTTA